MPSQNLKVLEEFKNFEYNSTEKSLEYSRPEGEARRVTFSIKRDPMVIQEPVQETISSSKVSDSVSDVSEED